MLRKILGTDNIEEEFHDLVAASEASKLVKQPWKNFRQRKYRPQLVMSFMIPMFQQLTGINVNMFYAPVLFGTNGFGANAFLMSSVITGCVNAGATLLSIATADKFGRRFLFLEGGVQMLICQVIVTVLIGKKFGLSGVSAELSKGYANVVVAMICLYVAAFAWSWGPLGWLVPSEIFPLEIRSAGQSVNVAVNMFFTFVVAQTKSIPIEEMVLVWKRHWFWKRFIRDEDVPQGLEMGYPTPSLLSGPGWNSSPFGTVPSLPRSCPPGVASPGTSAIFVSTSRSLFPCAASSLCYYSGCGSPSLLLLHRPDLANQEAATSLEEDQHNKRVVRALYEALTSGDVETVQRLLASDIEWWFHGPPSCQFLMRLLTGASDSGENFDFVPLPVEAFGPTVIDW